jgi:hypothetical protein
MKSYFFFGGQEEAEAQEIKAGLDSFLCFFDVLSNEGESFCH